MEIVSRALAKANGLKRFYTGKPCGYGHIDERVTSSGVCLECQRIRNRENYADPVKRQKLLDACKDRYHDPDVKERVRKRNASVAVKDRRKSYMGDWRANPEVKDAHKEYNARPDVKARKLESELRRRDCPVRSSRRLLAERSRYNTPEGKTRAAMRRMLKRCMTNKEDRTHKILGYTKSDLKAHLERQFARGMTWGNMGDWHIDHIMPIAHFIAAGEVRPEVINALTNLRPLWAGENLSKGSSVEFLL